MINKKSLKKYAVINIITLLLLISNINGAWAGTISNIRFGFPQKNIYRLVIEIDTIDNFKAFTLDSPNRVVVDIKGKHKISGNFTIGKDIPIKNYRIGYPDDHTTRVVFELNRKLKIVKSFKLKANKKYSNRIVIDLSQVDSKKKSISKQALQSNNFKYKIHSQNISKPIKAENIVIFPQRPIKKPSISNRNIKSNKIISASKQYIQNDKYTVAIDAGHGGKDPGANSGRRFIEKNITLALARALRDELVRTGRYRVIMTRNSDKFIKLKHRVNIARKAGADLFISLHADKIDRKNVRGSSVYTLSEKASDEETAKLAKRENSADIIAGVDLSHEDKDVANILIDIAVRDTMNNSTILANSIVSHFRKNNLRLLKKAHRSAGFAVLKAPDIPSVLIETGFISNRQEAKLLTSKAHQRKMAKAIRQSIDSFFHKLEQASLR